MNKTYIVKGPVRGTISSHRTLNAAIRSLLKDRRGCRKQGGYSDAVIIRADGQPLSAHEIEQLRKI
jgi:hypothetical protein